MFDADGAGLPSFSGSGLFDGGTEHRPGQCLRLPSACPAEDGRHGRGHPPAHMLRFYTPRAVRRIKRSRLSGWQPAS